MKSEEDNYIRRMQEMLKNKGKYTNTLYIYTLYFFSVLIYSQRLVIRISLQIRVLQEFNKVQLCMSRMAGLIRSYVYWPTMDLNIENCVKSCREGNANRRTANVAYYYLIVVDSGAK